MIPTKGNYFEIKSNPLVKDMIHGMRLPLWMGQNFVTHCRLEELNDSIKWIFFPIENWEFMRLSNHSSE